MVVNYFRDEHLSIIHALIKAAKICDTEDGRSRLSTILSHPQYLGVDEVIISKSLFTGSDGMKCDDFNVFSRFGVNAPSNSRANKVISQIRNAGLVKNLKDISINSVFREDIYLEALELSKKKQSENESSEILSMI